MSGGGGGGPFIHRTPSELSSLIRRAEEKAKNAEFETELAGLFSQLLGAYNARDAELVGQRMDDVRDVLSDITGEVFDQRFGGSVAKRTYVDGLSDIDALLIIDRTEFSDLSPVAALRKISDIVQDRLSDAAKVTYGQMAVTATYNDGMELQFLPATKSKDGFRIPSSSGDRWSNIDPEKFAKALSKRNQECGAKLVPTIKLAKAVLAGFPEEQRLSGYHVESLAVDIFRGYQGKNSTSEMLPYFFARAKDAVLKPIVDKTGQSVHVDEYMGAESSRARVNASHLLARISKRMANATASHSLGTWKSLFDGVDT